VKSLKIDETTYKMLLKKISELEQRIAELERKNDG
jgi:hypothetical protein